MTSECGRIAIYFVQMPVCAKQVNVTKRYDQTVVVDKVSGRIPRGGVTSIIGPNGAENQRSCLSSAD